MLLLAFATQQVALAAPPSQPAPAAAAYVPGRILVQPRAGLSDEEFDKLLRPHGGKRGRRLGGANVRIIDLPGRGNEMAVANALRKNPHIKFAELDEVVEPAATLTDPYVSTSWHLTKINAPTAWDASTGTGVVVAVLDTGVEGSHPDLISRLVPGWNIYSNNSNTSDVNGHGTAVAGTVAEAGNNSLGGAGVSWNAKIMPVRIADSNGSSSFSLITSGINYAADHGAKVVSISFKNLGNSSSVLAAAQYMRGKGGVVVVAAGNEGTLQSTAPSSYLVTVAATDSNDARASFSNYGSFIDIAAPGVQVKTTLKGGGYGWGTGTSFSTPVIAGAYALMMAANPGLSPAQLDSVLFSTAADLGTAGYDKYFGYGRVNAAAAVTRARSSGSSGDTISPTAAVSSPSAGAKVAGIVAVNASASDNVGVTKVELYVRGTLMATDLTSPYAFSWNTAGMTDGSATLQAKAYDAAGNYTLSAALSVTIANDSTAPVVSIASPVSGARVNGTVSISATATDNKQVSRMELWIDGVSVAKSTSGSLKYSWSVKSTSTRTTATTIIVRAYDPSNNVGSKSITVYR